MAAVSVDGGDQLEFLHQHRGEAVGQHAHQVVGATDMGVRESDGANVLGAHVEGPSQADAASDEGGVSVHRPLGIGGGT